MTCVELSWSAGEEEKRTSPFRRSETCCCSIFCAADVSVQSWGRALGRVGQVQVAGGVRKRRQGCPHPLLLVPRLAEQGSLCPCADAVLVLAPAACRAIWECSRTALEIRLALHCDGTVR